MTISSSGNSLTQLPGGVPVKTDAQGRWQCNSAPASAQDTLKIAIGQINNWENQAPTLGEDAGIFKKHNLKIEAFGTQGAGETIQAVVSGSADLGAGVGVAGVMRAFSKGTQQRVAIARTLLHDPPVLFFDEPTAALDPEAAKAVRDYLAQVVADRGKAVLLCTHNLPEAERLCRRLSVLSGGRQVAESARYPSAPGARSPSDSRAASMRSPIRRAGT